MNMNIDLTKREKQVLELLSSEHLWKPPSGRVISKIIGIHFSHVYILIKYLKLKGFLDESGKPFERKDASRKVNTLKQSI